MRYRIPSLGCERRGHRWADQTVRALERREPEAGTDGQGQLGADCFLLCIGVLYEPLS